MSILSGIVKAAKAFVSFVSAVKKAWDSFSFKDAWNSLRLLPKTHSMCIGYDGDFVSPAMKGLAKPSQENMELDQGATIRTFPPVVRGKNGRTAEAFLTLSPSQLAAMQPSNTTPKCGC